MRKDASSQISRRSLLSCHLPASTTPSKRPICSTNSSPSARRSSRARSARERAALAWVELLTNLPPHGVSDADYLAVREHFKEAELAELGYAIVLINGWNRLAVGFAAQPGALDKVYGLDKAGLH